MQAQRAVLRGGKRLTSQPFEFSTELPLVTVITAVYNMELRIAGCVESVLRQDYPNIEHIVIDGCSSDGTVDILRRYSNQIALWQSELDDGLYYAWNKGLIEARGEWICFLGADDEFLPDAVSNYMAFATRNPSAEYLGSKVEVVDPSGYKRIWGRPWTWKRFQTRMTWLHAGSMHRRSLFDRLGVYDVSYKTVADYEFLLRAGPQLKAAYMPVLTVVMRTGGISHSRQAIEEHIRATVITGRRNKSFAAVRLLIANLRYKLRPLRCAIGKLIAHLVTNTDAGPFTSV